LPRRVGCLTGLPDPAGGENKAVPGRADDSLSQ